MDTEAPSTMAAAKSPPLDLSHHFSIITNLRQPSEIKKYYKFFMIPGIGNLAGGLPNPSLFPFDTLEAQAAKPDRWTPTPNEPPSPDAVADRIATATLSSAPNGKSLNRDGPRSGGAKPNKESDKSSSWNILGSRSTLDETEDDDDDNPEGPKAAGHIVVPKERPEKDPFKRIDLATALQYGTAEGYPALLSFVRQFTRKHLHPNVPYANGPEVVLTCGSTDGFSKSLELLTNPWNPAADPPETRPHLLVEKFLYAQVLAQSLPRGVRPVPIEIDDEGMLVSGPGGLEAILAGWDDRNGRRPHFMYTVTMGHNPTSGVLSTARRKEIYALCQEYDIIIVEDDPYWFLQYPSAAPEEAVSRSQASPKPQNTHNVLDEGSNSSGFPFLDSLVPSYLNMDVDGRVLRLDTFSKTIAPGCRLGWITAQPEFIERIVRIAETSTQQPSGFVQAMVAELLIGPQTDSVKQSFSSLSRSQQPAFEGWDVAGWVRWLEGLRGTYERRMQRMSRILDDGACQLKQSTPVRDDLADWGVVTKTRLYDFAWPRGGMFLWLRVHFEDHPLWMARGPEGCDLPLVDGPALGLALVALCVRKPHLVVPAPGAMFAANDAVRAESAWAHYRLCFAATSEEDVDACSKRFVSAVHKFWRIKKVEEIADLVREFQSDEVEKAAEAQGLGNLAGMGHFC